MIDIVERLLRLYVQNGTNYVQEAADEIKRLRAKVEHMEHEARTRAAAAVYCYDKKEAEVEALRADAEAWRAAQEVSGAYLTRLHLISQYAKRYAYLRDIKRQKSLTLNGPEAGVWCDCEDEVGTLVLLTEDDLDEAIDEAMRDESNH